MLKEKKQIEFDEGRFLKVYRCTQGYITIGVGRNLQTNGLTSEEVFYLANNNPERKERLKEHLNSSNIILFNKLFEDIQEHGITNEEADYLFDNDFNEVVRQLRKKYTWFDYKEIEVRRILINMCFNMGISTLDTFKNTLKFIKESDYKSASQQMLKSKWARQVPKRAKRLSERMAKV